MFCCRNCFIDPIVIKFILKNGRLRNCDFCKRIKVKAVPAEDLKGLFNPLLNKYCSISELPNPHFGQGVEATLAECIYNDGWELFSESIEEADSLLDAIRGVSGRPDEAGLYLSSGDSEWVRNDWEREGPPKNYLWDNFATHIKRERRFIFDRSHALFTKNTSWLRAYLRTASRVIPPSARFYRARLGFNEQSPYKAISRKEMGAPPKNKATAGRANPQGIPYLYCTEDFKTAVAESRAFLGAKVSVIMLKTVKELRVADLSEPQHLISPFGHANLEAKIEQRDFLNTLNFELSRPVNPNDAGVDYLPTQFVSEFILSLGYDGIRYRSAMRENGKNLVFFAEGDLKFSRTAKLVQVFKQEIQFR